MSGSRMKWYVFVFFCVPDFSRVYSHSHYFPASHIFNSPIMESISLLFKVGIIIHPTWSMIGYVFHSILLI